MGRHPEIDPKILMDWLVEATHNRLVPRRELQVVGVAVMLIACEYEAPDVWSTKVVFYLIVSYLSELTLNS
jgi:hypothetical protein